jgi:GxxExxY protein
MLPDGDVTGKVIGCAMKVHSTLGNGFPEVIYHRALAKELTACGIEFKSEAEVSIHYQGEPIGVRRVDFLIANRIPVEIKALSSLEPTHFSQAVNYLESYDLPIGLLLNFGSSSLQFHRITNKKFLARSH